MQKRVYVNSMYMHKREETALILSILLRIYYVDCPQMMFDTIKDVINSHKIIIINSSLQQLDIEKPQKMLEEALVL